MDLEAQCRSVQSREDLVHFVRALVDDLKLNPGDWENSDLADFLAALAAWTEDMDGYYLNRRLPVPGRPDWSTLADMMMGARIYE